MSELVDHPDEAGLAALARGELVPEEAERLREHASSCSRCSQRLFTLATGAGEAEPTSVVPRQVAAEGAVLAPDSLSLLPRGSSIGRYVVLDRVGQGGMGVVYAAFDPELDRRVAIKLLHARAGASGSAGSGSDTWVGPQALLLREAQAMARLSHPNVLAVHDVGLWSGRVFVAMELVEGQSLRQRLKAGLLPAPEARRIMEAAGEGLAAAHSKDLIHRDFKADNIMVGDDGRVRVTDFGLARAAHVGPAAPAELAGAPAEGVAPELASPSGTLLTEAGFVHGTPAYMAPEQLTAGVSDARSDQFSFGVTLHEALYGERPFGPDRPADPALWRVREGKAGSTVPAWLRRVALRCLELRPEDRFGSMREVLAALRADPARGRRRALVAAGVAAAVLASAGLAYGVAASRLRLCAGMEQHLAGVWDEAQREAVRQALAGVRKPFAADAANVSTRQLDGYARAWVGMRQQACEATRLRGEAPEPLLALRLSCLDRRLESVSALVSVLKAADADVARQAIDAIAGLPSLDACADVAALTALVPPPEDAAARERVEALRKRLADPKARLLAAQFRQGLEPARAAAVEAAALGYPPLVAEAQQLLGGLEEGVGDYKASERAFTAAVHAAQAGRDDELGARAWAALALVAGLRQARWEPAHDAVAMAKATLSRLGGRDALLAEVRLAEARLLLAEGRYQDALEVAREAESLVLRTLGEERVETANAMHTVGQCLLKLGRLDASIEAGRKALAIRRRVLGPDHPETANAIHGLATAHHMAGRYEEALPLYLESLSIRERALGMEHSDLAYSLNNLTALFATQRKFGEALPYAERTLRLQEAVYGPEHPFTGTALHNLGALHGDMGNLETALELLERGARVREKSLGPEHPEVAQSRATVSSVLLRLGRGREALDEARRALAIREKVLPPGHREVGLSLLAVGLADIKLGRAAEALPFLERALKIHEESRGIPPGSLADVRFALARALWSAGLDRARARALAEAAEATYAERKMENRLQEMREWRQTRR